MDVPATLTIMFVFIGLMVFFYMKKRIWVLILMIYLFSLLFGVIALEEGNIPFTPYFQFFFMLFQSTIFVLTSINLFQKGRESDEK